MELHQRALAHLAARGIDVTTAPEHVDRGPLDLVAYRVQCTADTLALMVPARFRKATTEHPEVQAWIDGFLADPTTAPNMIMIGGTGSGKTHHTYAALRAAATGIAHTGRLLDWRAYTHPDFNAALRVQPDDKHLAELDRMLGCDLLILDDLAAGKLSDWAADCLYRIVDTRWAEQRPIIATSNLDPEHLRDALGDRIMSRFADGTVIRLLGADRRRAGNAS